MTFEVLCVTMHQTDFSKIEEMNIRSNIVFANQADRTSYEEEKHGEKCAKMITTHTRGVGINRNLALMYATADICLFADDDVVYYDDMEERVLKEFEEHPDADIIIFHFETEDNERTQIKYKKTRKCRGFFRKPWGGIRIAFRLTAVQKANLWFTSLFGGGCVFPSGEDSIWLKEAQRKGLIFYVSKETIGTVSTKESTWFSGYNEKFFYGKGACYSALYPRSIYFWILYICYRYRSKKGLVKKERLKWICNGVRGYKKAKGFDAYCEREKLNK